MTTTQTPAEYEGMLTKHWDYEAFPTGEDAIHSVASCAGDTGATGQIDIWPELQPLIAKTEAQDYPLDALPPLIRNAVIEVCGFVKAATAAKRRPAIPCRWTFARSRARACWCRAAALAGNG